VTSRYNSEWGRANQVPKKTAHLLFNGSQRRPWAKRAPSFISPELTATAARRFNWLSCKLLGLEEKKANAGAFLPKPSPRAAKLRPPWNNKCGKEDGSYI
jgi:hypothetical protein